MKKIIPILLSMLLIGCATAPENEYAAPEGIPHARIRVHHAPRAKIYLTPSCDGETISFNASDSSLFASNKKIGMPQTEFSSRFLSTWREYTIPAGYRTHVSLNYLSSHTSSNMTVTRRCPIMTFSFIPEAGKDYDAFSYHSNGRCYIAVRELTKGEGDIATTKQIEGGLPPCPKKETQKAATK